MNLSTEVERVLAIRGEIIKQLHADDQAVPFHLDNDDVYEALISNYVLAVIQSRMGKNDDPPSHIDSTGNET